MNFTVKECLEKFKGQYQDVEVYTATNSNNDLRAIEFYTDFIKYYGDASDVKNTDCKALSWELMDEDTYNHTILSNTCNTFSDFYEEDEKVLVLLIPQDENDLDE